jgi:hypothetical protein
MSQSQSTNRRASAARLVTSLGVALLVVAVAVVAYLFGLGFFQTAEPTPTILAVAPTMLPTAIPPTNTPTPTSTATWTPTPTSTPTPTPSPTPELGTSNVYVEYILDASGSMNETLPGGGIKLAVAKKLLTENLQAFRPETNVGLRAYGHRVYYQQTAKSCHDIELIAPVEKGQMETIVTWLGDFKAQGMTPLAESIRQAMDDFVFDPAHINSIVMLSDGIETCGGDPCGLVEELKAEGVNFTIHVIGLDVDEATREQLTCIAQVGGGTYHDANSEQELDEALGIVQKDVTADEVITAYRVDTPMPAPPTRTPTPEPPSPTPTSIPASPTPNPKPITGDRIVFASQGKIYVISADGSQLIHVNSDSVSGDEPSWSPDCKRIVFSCTLKTGRDICIINEDGSGLVNLTNNPDFDRAPAWSANGISIVFNSTKELGTYQSDIFAINADGSSMRNLTNSPGNEGFPSWSSDGSRIIFASFRGGRRPEDGQWDIYAMNADGSGVTQLTDTGDIEENPTWSPDGSRIAFGLNNGSGFGEIYIMNSDGSGRRNLTNTWGDDSGPSWSPDGTHLAFMSMRDDNWEIYVMNADGSNARRLTNNPDTDWYPSWCPKP